MHPQTKAAKRPGGAFAVNSHADEANTRGQGWVIHGALLPPVFVVPSGDGQSSPVSSVPDSLCDRPGRINQPEDEKHDVSQGVSDDLGLRSF